MIQHITFTDERMTISADKCRGSALNYGASRSEVFRDFSIDKFFTITNREILSNSRGFGFWIWKPYFIYSMMQAMNEGDVLLYSDAGIEFIAPLKHIIDRMDEDIYFHDNGWSHVQWCKGDILNTILPGFNDPHPVRFESKFTQVQASVIYFKVNQKTRDFVKEWLLYCQMPGLIDDSPSKAPNHEIFIENRHDQAILSSLCLKYGYKKHWWASTIWVNEQFRYPQDDIPPMYNHHRNRNPGLGGGHPEW